MEVKNFKRISFQYPERRSFLAKINPSLAKLVDNIICTIVRLFFMLQGSFVIVLSFCFKKKIAMLTFSKQIFSF